LLSANQPPLIQLLPHRIMGTLKERHCEEFFEDAIAKRKGIFQNSVAISHSLSCFPIMRLLRKYAEFFSVQINLQAGIFSRN